MQVLLLSLVVLMVFQLLVKVRARIPLVQCIIAEKHVACLLLLLLLLLLQMMMMMCDDVNA